MEAQRFPADYDGIVAGDAANFWTHQMMNEVWDGVATSSPETNFSRDKLQQIQDAVMDVCDTLDGLKDGLISDPTRCHFDPKKLLCKGAEEADLPDVRAGGRGGETLQRASGPANRKEVVPGILSPAANWDGARTADRW